MVLDNPIALAAIGVKLAWVLAALTAIGLATHSAFGIAPPKRAALVGAAFALAGAVISRLFISAAELGGDWSETAAMLHIIWSVQKAVVLITLGAAASLVLGALASIRVLLVVGAVAAAFAFGMTGHSQSAEAPTFAPFFVGPHVLIAGYWSMSPVSLWPGPTLSTSELAFRHERFGSIALAAVPVLFVSGAVLALSFGGGFAALISSDYGAVLAVKTAAATVALGIGAWNKLAIAKALQRAEETARHRLRLAMAADALLFFSAAFAVALATTVFAPGA